MAATRSVEADKIRFKMETPIRYSNKEFITPARDIPCRLLIPLKTLP